MWKSMQFETRKLRIKKLSPTLFLILCLLAATALRSFFFSSYGTFANDDPKYVGIASHFLPNLMISLDGINPHTIFPPGYPIFLAFQELIFGSYFAAIYFQFVFITSLISLLTLAIGKLLNLKITYLSIVLCVLNPVLIVHPATLQISAGTWYTIIILTGTFFLLKFSRKFEFKFLLLGSSCYAFGYLHRPEGLGYFSAVIAVLIFWYLKTKPEKNIASFLKPFACVALPLAFFAFPYIYYIYANTGELALSGKSTYHAMLASELNKNHFEHYTANILSLGRTFITPLFIGPLILTLFLGYVWLALSRRIRTDIKDWVLLIPIPLILFALVLRFPWARAIYSSIPVFLLLSLKTVDYLHNKFNPSLKTQNLLLISIILYQLVIILSPVILERFDNTPKLYYQATDFITHEMALVNNEKAVVYSRDFTLRLYNKNIEVCSDLEACEKKLDYLILSNLTHVKLAKKSSHEENKIFKPSIMVKGEKCNRARTFSRGAFYTEVYSCG